MANVGVRELKNQATEIPRTIREERTEYIVASFLERVMNFLESVDSH